MRGHPGRTWTKHGQCMQMIKHLRRWCVLWAVLTAMAQPGGAQPPEAQGKLTLNQAIEIALKNHPAIKESKENVAAAQAQVGVSRANYFPQVRYTDNYFYGTTVASATTGSVSSLLASGGPSGSISAPSGTSAGATLNTNPGHFYIHRFAANQLIYDFGKTPGQVGQSKANFEATRQDLANTRQQVALDAKSAYYGYLATKAAVKVSEENVRLNRELVRQAEGFYKVGVRARIDVTKAEANLYNAESDLITAKNSFQVAQVTLMTALGLKSWPFSEVEGGLDFQPLKMSLAEAKEQSFTARPELVKNQFQQEAGKQGVRVARSGYYPTLSSQAIYGWQGADRPLVDSWYVGVGVNMPLFEGLATKYSVQQAKSNLRAAEANYEVLQQNVNKEVEQFYLDVQAAAERIRSTAKARESAQENWRLADGRYRAGVGNIIEVTDAQVQYFQSDLAHIRALYDYKTAQARLDKAVGKVY